MENHRKLETPDIRMYLIPLMLLSGIFLVSSFFLMRGIRTHYYSLKEREALKAARSYAMSLKKFSEAETLIEGLLEEKIRVAGSAVSVQSDLFSNRFFQEQAAALEVDELDYYTPEGVLLYSNLPEVLGWKIYDGHPIDVFLKSPENSLIEEIRQDVITGNFYKYGYYKLQEGGLIQVGLKADRVQSLLDQYKIDSLLSDMQKNQDALAISLLSPSLEVLATTKDTQELDIRAEEVTLIQKSLKDHREYSTVAENKKELYYKVFVPLENTPGQPGLRTEGHALAVAYSMEDTAESIRKVSLYGLTALLLIYAILLYTMRQTYRNTQRLLKVAYYDTLTELPNVEHLRERTRTRGSKTPIQGMVLLNIENLKHLNVTYGYDFGDEVLQAAAKRLKRMERRGTALYRFSGDRFILTEERPLTGKDFEILSQKLRTLFEKPLKVRDILVPMTLRIGGALAHEEETSLEILLKKSTVALEEAHKTDAESVLFHEEMLRTIQREDILLSELREALETQDRQVIYLEYQPILSRDKEKPEALEALARMRSKTFGPISPMEFIPVAEKNQLIRPLGTFILRCALETIGKLQEEGMPVRIAVNISGLQLLEMDFEEKLLQLMEKMNLSPQLLSLEITESVLLENFSVLNEKLKKLRTSGIEIALDDFGTGYSSFMRLQELHIDTLKIDREFIWKIGEEAGETLVSDLIRMAHRMHLKVVAEGVETTAQREYLSRHCCDYLQGFQISRPLSEKEALEFVRL